MTKIMLIRHAEPAIVKNTPAKSWVLTDAGKNAASALGTRLSGLGLAKLASSSEPKALQTAQIIANRLDIQVDADPRLREHERASVGFLDQADFETGIASIFSNPSDIAFGEESANTVHARLSAAIEDAKAGNGGVTAVVTHGTAMSIYVSRMTGIAPMPFWRELRMPVAVMVEDNRIVSIVQ